MKYAIGSLLAFLLCTVLLWKACSELTPPLPVVQAQVATIRTDTTSNHLSIRGDNFTPGDFELELIGANGSAIDSWQFDVWSGSLLIVPKTEWLSNGNMNLIIKKPQIKEVATVETIFELRMRPGQEKICFNGTCLTSKQWNTLSNLATAFGPFFSESDELDKWFEVEYEKMRQSWDEIQK